MNTAESVWEPAYRARFNQHLHALLATRYARLSTMTALLAALSASAALAGSLAMWAPWVAQALTALAALSAAIAPIMDWGSKHAFHQELHAGYRSLEWRCRRNLVDAEGANAELEQLEQREKADRPLRFEHLRMQAESLTKRELGLA